MPTKEEQPWTDTRYLSALIAGAQAQIDVLDKKVDRVVAFIETVEKGMEAMGSNPMLRALLPKDLGGKRNG